MACALNRLDHSLLQEGISGNVADPARIEAFLRIGASETITQKREDHGCQEGAQSDHRLLWNRSQLAFLRAGRDSVLYYDAYLPVSWIHHTTAGTEFICDVRYCR